MRQKLVIFDVNSLVFGLNTTYNVIKNILTPLDIHISNKQLINARYGNVSTIIGKYIRESGEESIATNMVVDNSIAVLNDNLRRHIDIGDVTEKSNVKKTMDMLKHEGYKIGVSSGFDSIVTEKLLSDLFFKRYVDSWVAVDNVKYGKPYPYMIYTLMEECKITSSENVIKIVTSDIDVNVAINANCGLIFKDTELNTYQEDMLSDTNYPSLDAIGLVV